MRILLAIVLFLASSMAHAAGVENKWRLQFSGDAESDGVLVLSFTPTDGEPSTVSIDIKEGTGENAVARLVRDKLRESIGEYYRVERDDGEDVLVKRRLGEHRFNVTVVSNSVRGVRLNLDQE